MSLKPWEKQERRLAHQTGGQRSAASGALSRKGDVRSRFMLIEAKTTGNRSYTIQSTELEKIWREALIDDRLPVLQFDLNGTAYAIVPWDDLLGLVERDDVLTRVCSDCQQEFPLTGEFWHRNPSNPGGHYYTCRSCTNEARLAHKRELQAWVNTFKTSPCADCGDTFPPYVMDFDHRRGEKVAPVSQMVANKASRERILAEIEKCDLVCSNCHRIRTFNDGYLGSACG